MTKHDKTIQIQVSWSPSLVAVPCDWGLSILRNLPPAASVPPSASRHPGRCTQLFAHLQETRASLGTKRNRIWMLHRAWPNQSCVRCCVSVCHVKNENCYGAGSMASLSCELQFLSGHPLTASPHHPNSQAPDIQINLCSYSVSPSPPQITAEVTATIFPNGTLFMNWAGPPDGGGIEL